MSRSVPRFILTLIALSLALPLLLIGQFHEIGWVKYPDLAPQNRADIVPAVTAIDPMPVIGVIPPSPLSSQTWEVSDLASTVALSQLNPDSSVPMASLTKLMTALLVRQSDNPGDIVEITTADVAISPTDSHMGLVAGERVSVKDLLYGLLIPSGNDAALALARHTSGSVDAFTKKMNDKASELGLKHTRFTNPIGLDDAGHYSSADDLTKLARVTLPDTLIRQIVSTRTSLVKTASGQQHQLTNTNLLLGKDGVIGIKTGHTDAAGDCLIVLARIGDHEIISTLLGSSDRFGETERLIQWTRENVIW